MSADKRVSADQPVSRWHTLAASVRRFFRERRPGWEGTDGADPPSTREIGQRGEKVARWYLEKHGYQILETNWWAAGRWGELDIVAWHDNTLIGVEVKSYPAGEMTPAEALRPRKRSRLARLIKQYAKLKRRFDCSLRVDLVVIEWAERGKVGTIRHIESVATGDDL
jgi:putative endonuclease